MKKYRFIRLTNYSEKENEIMYRDEKTNNICCKLWKKPMLPRGSSKKIVTKAARENVVIAFFSHACDITRKSSIHCLEKTRVRRIFARRILARVNNRH